MINFDNSEIEAARKALGKIENGMEKAVVSSINKTLGKVKTEAKRKIREEYNIKASDIDKTFSVKKANYTTLQGTVTSKSHSFKLHKFLTGYTSDGKIKVKIKKKESPKILKGNPKYNGNPFIATLKTGHKGIFQRKDGAAYPIKELTSISVAGALGTEKVSTYVNEEGMKHLSKNLEKEVERILKGYVK